MKTILLVIYSLFFFAASAMAGGSCGDSRRVAFLLHEVFYADDRPNAESRLISGVFPISACLSREGYQINTTRLPGRLGIVLEILGALRGQSVRMSTPEDVDRKIRLWKVGLAEKRGKSI